MKKSLLFVLGLMFFLTTVTFAQDGMNGFQYQAVVRKADGKELTNQKINTRFTVLSGSSNGVEVYTETQKMTTNQFGLFNHIVGRGTPASSIKLTDVDFSVSNYFLKVELDLTGGSNFQPFGSSELLAVPFALYAKSSGNGNAQAGGNFGPTGDQGLAGDKGIQGDKGLRGDKGLQGERGIRGEDGLKGLVGDKGPKGDAGLVGEKGATGLTGLTGVTGAKGIIGDKGVQGDKGLPGDAGAKGTEGKSAYQVWEAIAGNNGKSNLDYIASLVSYVS